MMNIRFLEKLGACDSAIKWCDQQEGIEQAWETCPQGGWMLWIAAKLGIDRKLIVLAACDCAELSLVYVPEGENRPRLAIKVARAWANGEATISEVRRAADALAYAAYAAHDRAADAADAAAYATHATDAYAARAAADAAYAAAYAARAYAAEVADAHAYDVHAHAANAAKVSLQCAGIVRNQIEVKLILQKMRERNDVIK